MLKASGRDGLSCVDPRCGGIALLAILNALVQPSNAASFYFQESTEFLCSVPNVVVVGRVLERNSYPTPSGLIDSKVRFDVERQVKGGMPDPFTFTIGGGVVGDVTSYDSWSPRSDPGSRYVLFLTMVGVAAPVVSAFYRVDEDVDLPSTGQLQELLATRCAGV